MPNLDGTGPYGKGPNGRGMGPCRSGGRVAFGTGRGRRMGRGRALRVLPEYPGADIKTDIQGEIEALEARIKYLKEQMTNERNDAP